MKKIITEQQLQDLKQNPVTKPLPEHKFWAIIKASLKAHPGIRDKDLEAQFNWLNNYFIQQNNLRLIVEFRARLWFLMSLSYVERQVQIALWIITGAYSDYVYEYSRAWLISRGSQVFYGTIKKADYLYHYLKDKAEKGEIHSNEGFLSVGQDAWETLTGQEGLDLNDYDQTQRPAYNRYDFFDTSDDKTAMIKVAPLLSKHLAPDYLFESYDLWLYRKKLL